MPLKVESTSHIQRPNATVNLTQTTRITGLQIGGSIPDKLFTVPSGYKMVQANNTGRPGSLGPGGMVPRP